MNRVRIQWRFLVVATLLSACVTASAQTYTLVDLGEVGDPSSAATGVNNAGQVVGTYSTYYALHAAVWNGTTPTSLGSLGGRFSAAVDINNAGQVVGWSNTTADMSTQATVWTGTTPTPLGSLGGTFGNVATGINDAGVIVGYSYAANNVSMAVTWNGTAVPTVLSSLGGSSSAQAINNVGQVIGGSGEQAVVWNNGIPTVLDSLGGQNAVQGINDAGKVVGSSGRQAVVWNGTTPTALDSLGGTTSYAKSINISAQVVGASQVLGDSTFHAVLWNGTTATDLNTFASGTRLVLTESTGINDAGWIVGTAMHEISNNEHAFLLIPSAVPSPPGFSLAFAGLVLLGFVSQHRKRVVAAERTPRACSLGHVASVY